MPRSITTLDTKQKCPKPGAHGKREKTMTYEEIKECWRTGEAVTDAFGNDYTVLVDPDCVPSAHYIWLLSCDDPDFCCFIKYQDLEHAL